MDGISKDTIIRVRVKLKVIAIKEYSTLLNILELEPHHQIQLNVTSFWEKSNPSA